MSLHCSDDAAFWFWKTRQHVFFPLHLLFPSCTKQNTHMNTHRLFISLRLTLQLGILEFGFWFSMENFNWESSCAWSIWWESVTFCCQTSQACSVWYNICLPADSEWLFSMAGKVRERGHTTEPNLSYKSTLQTTGFTLLIPSSFMSVATAPSSTVISFFNAKGFVELQLHIYILKTS